MIIVGIATAAFTITLAALANRDYITVNWPKIAGDLQAWLTEIAATVVAQTLLDAPALQSFMTAYVPL